MRPIIRRGGAGRPGKSIAVITCLALAAGMTACDSTTDPDPVGEPISFSYAPCPGSTNAPEWVALQDGTTTGWTRVTPTSGKYDFTISRGRGGIATYNPADGLVIFYGTTSELQANYSVCSVAPRPVTGSVTAYGALDNIQIFMGGDEAFVSGSQPAPAAFELTQVDADATDIVGVRYREASGISIVFQRVPSNVVIRRSVTGSSTPVLDFSSVTEAGAPVQKTVTVTNVAAGEDIGVTTTLELKATRAELSYYQTAPATIAGSVSAAFYGVAGARLGIGEAQSMLVEATRTSGSVKETRSRSLSFDAGADLSVALGPSLGSVTVNGGSRPSASWTLQNPYSLVFGAVFDQGSGDAFRQVKVVATSEYLRTPSQVKLEVPDLSSAAGFSTSWLLVPGVTSGWDFAVAGLDGGTLTSQSVTLVGAEKSGTFVP